MKIIIDVGSGDNAPDEIVKGALLAAKEFGCSSILVGDKRRIVEVASENEFNLSMYDIEIAHATEVITMEDSAFSFRTKKDSSMTKALQLLKQGEGDAVVSAGNTGALYAGASLIVTRIPTFRKAAIATTLPYQNPVLLLDSGANIVVTEDDLEQFAIMGSVYCSKMYGITSPRVGLLNNGTEKTKGNETLQKTYQKLENNNSLNFVGNIESKVLPFNVCDVLVTDGFTGNVVLKLTEGLGTYLMSNMKDVFLTNFKTKIAAFLIKKELRAMKNKFDPSEDGGAPILGVAKPVIKAHGSSNAKAIKNAVKYAMKFAEENVIDEIKKLGELKQNENK